MRGAEAAAPHLAREDTGLQPRTGRHLAAALGHRCVGRQFQHGDTGRRRRRQAVRVGHLQQVLGQHGIIAVQLLLHACREEGEAVQQPFDMRVSAAVRIQAEAVGDARMLAGEFPARSRATAIPARSSGGIDGRRVGPLRRRHLDPARIEVEQRADGQVLGHRMAPEFALDDKRERRGERVALARLGRADPHLPQPGLIPFDRPLDAAGKLGEIIGGADAAGERRHAVVQHARLHRGESLQLRRRFLGARLGGGGVQQGLQVAQHGATQLGG